MTNFNRFLWLATNTYKKRFLKSLAVLAATFAIGASRILSISRNPMKVLLSIFRRYKNHLDFVKTFVSSMPFLNEFAYAQFARYYSTNRYYLKEHLTPKTFFEALNDAGENYILLRWWEDINNWDTSEDFDIAVIEPNAEVWEHLLQKAPGEYKVDVYTDSGNLDGELTTPYLTGQLLTDAVSSRQLYADFVYVPSSRYFCYCLMYHMLFHKGVLSGLKFSDEKVNHTDTRYWGALEKNFSDLGFQIGKSAEDFSSVLKKAGYFPTGDLLEKYIEKRPELDFLSDRRSVNIFDDFLLMFVRERYSSDQTASCIAEILENERYSVLCMEPIQKQDVDFIASRVRGGNWTRGGYEVSAGKPTKWILAVDRNTGLSSDQKLARKQLAKKRIRNRIQQKTWWRRIGNPVHSTDFGYETEEYLQLLLPRSEYQEYFYLASSLAESESQKRGRFCLTWTEKNPGSFVKFFGPYHRTMHLKELKFGEQFAKRNFSLIPTFTKGCVLKYPICKAITGTETQLNDQWVEFFRFLKEQKIICLDIAFEQFVIDDKGRLKFTDFKFCLEEQSAFDWSFWFKHGLVPFTRITKITVPIGYGSIIESKLAVMKRASVL